MGETCYSLLVLLLGSVSLGGETLLSLLDNGELDTVALGEGDPRLAGLADDEDVVESGGEDVAGLILEVDDLVASGMSLTVSDDTNSANVVTARDDSEHTNVKLEEV